MSDPHQCDVMHATKEEISDLVGQEQDPGKRAHLMIMLRLLGSLESVTISAGQIERDLRSHKIEFGDHRKEFNDHVKDEESILNRGKGMWWSSLVFIALIQGIVLWQFNRFVDAFDRTLERVEEVEKDVRIEKEVNKQLRAQDHGVPHPHTPPKK